MKEVRQVRHRPVCEVESRVITGQVPGCVREQEVRDVCETRCVPVCETVIKECRYVARRKVCEEVLRTVVCSSWQTVTETRFKKVCRVEKVPVTCCKPVERKHMEWVTEQYCVPGKKMVTWRRDPASFNFDPCTMKGACDPGRLVKCEVQCPDEIRCRRVPRIVTCCEMVPVTKYERHVIEEEIPYTVCRKVKVQECRQVPVKVARIVHEVCTKQVPVTVRRMVPETVTRQVVVNKTRQVRGAYVDKKGVGHANPWLGRRFVEGACWEKTLTCVKRRTVCEETVRQVPCVNYKMVMEKRVKQVPYTVCRMEQRSTTRMVNCKVTDMVEETKTRKIPYTVCTIVPCCRTRVVKEKVCEMVPYTVKVPVPVTYTEQIECVVKKRVPICVEKDVCVRRLRLDPVCQDPCLQGLMQRVQPVDPVRRQAPQGAQAPYVQSPKSQSPSIQAPITKLSFTQSQ